MKNLQSHPALRDLRAHLRQSGTWAGMIGVAAILAIAAPFETGEVMRLLPRCLYWLVIVVACYACGYLVSDLVRPFLANLARPLAILITGCVTGICVSVIVLVVNYVALDFFPAPHEWVAFFVPILLISMIVTAVITVIGENLQNAQSRSATAVPLLDRIPFDKRAALVALSVEDHYVRIRTLKGEELVLMRLSDAMKEVGTTRGAQVHRSHWAAFDQVASVRREGDRAVLTMKTGIEIPVSRANISHIKEAGLLPR